MLMIACSSAVIVNWRLHLTLDRKKIVKLGVSFFFNRLKLNVSETEFFTFPRKIDKRLQNSKTVVLGSSSMEKTSQCKNLGGTID